MPPTKAGWAQKIVRAGASAISDMKVRLDSWANALTGLNTARDKTTQTLPYFTPTLSPLFLEELYHGDDIANRIINAVPDECFREPWMVTNKSTEGEELIQERSSELDQELKLLGAREKMREAMAWGRLYGLGAVLMGIDDGQPPWEPVDWERVRGVDYLTVLDKRDLTPWRWYADPQAQQFGDVAIYLMQPVGVFVGAPYDIFQPNQILLVHESRMLRFGGELTSKRRRLANQGSDFSVLQRCFRALQLTNDNWQSAAMLMSDASQGVFKIKGLIDMIAQQPDIMTSRFQFMDMARSVTRAIVLDADGEEFERIPSRFEGIPNLLEQTWKRLAMAARIPLPILMGVSDGGLNATGDMHIRWWYDTISATQEQQILPNLERLERAIALSKGWDEPEHWSAVFPPLWQMTEKELAELHFQQAQADGAMLDRGVLTPEEVALSRFGYGKYDLDTKIDVETRKRVMEISMQAMKEEAANDLETAKDPGPTPGVIAKQNQETQASSPDPRPPGVVTD